MAFIFVYVTYPNEKTADKITAHLLKSKLIACANIFPIKSTYMWKGTVKQDREIVTLLKANKKNYSKIKKEIKKIHPYEVPCITKIDVSSNKEFDSWINSFH